MPLTPLQRQIFNVIRAQRSPDSFVYDATVIHYKDCSPRFLGRRLRCLLSTTIIIFSSEAFGQLEAPLDPAFRLVSTAVEEEKVPGAIGVVSRHDRVVREEAFGYCDAALKRPMTTDTLCWIASITKPVTATAAMLLVEEDQLSLEDSVETYLPEFKDQRASDGEHYPITIRQLMSHSSGIQPNPPLRPSFFFEAEWYARDIEEIAPAVSKTPLLFKPGSQVNYSNAAPYVLARIIELRSGMRYDRFVQRRILDPLEMRDTFFAPPVSTENRLAEVIRREDGREDSTFFHFDPKWQMNMAMPDGGLFATAADVVKFTQAFVANDGRLLSKSSVEAMLTEQAPGWGLGWALSEDGSFYHTGSSGTLTWGNPRTGIAAALFCQIQDYKTRAHESLELRERFRDAVEAKSIVD